MRNGFLAAVCFLALVLTVPLAAQDADGSGLEFGFALGLGTASVPENPREAVSDTNPLVTYQKIALQPDISFGKLGVGLDLTVHFNLDLGSGGDGIQFYEPDWIPEKAGKSFLELYLPKIAYVRWGLKGEPLYAKLGSFDDGTLGNGFIMGNYSNTRFLPETRIFGAAFDLDGALFDFPYVGIETFAGNVALLDVVGSRFYVRPLAGTKLPLLSMLQVGATVAVDREPQLYDGNDDNDEDGDSVAVFGGDVRLPLFANPAATMALFGDVAFQNEGRWGSAVGLGGKLVSFIPYTLQLRFLGPDFIPTYFDSSYDLFRAAKYSVLEQEPEGDAYAGWLARLGFSLLGDLLIFSVSADGSFAEAESGSVSISDYPHVRGTFTLAEGLLAGFSIDALYEKYLLGAPESVGGTGDFLEDLISPENAVIGAQINYKTGPAVLSLIYNLRYDPDNGYIVTSSLMSSIRF